MTAVTCFLGSFLWLAAGQAPPADSDAKSLYLRQMDGTLYATPPNKPKASQNREDNRPEAEAGAESIGLKYWVNLVSERNRAGSRVATNRVFRSGEAIQLIIQPNIDGYLSVVNLAPDGAATRLFPASTGGLTDSFVQAGAKTVIPGSEHFFEFGGEPGKERLFLILTKTEREMDEFRLEPQVAPQNVLALTQRKEQATGAKALKLASFADDRGPDPGSYAVNIKGYAVIVEIELTHQP